MLCEIPDIGFGCLNWVSKSGLGEGMRVSGRREGEEGRGGWGIKGMNYRDKEK